MLNKVILMGRLTADPELRRTQSERSVTSFSLAVNRSFVKKGEKPEVDFIECVAWSSTAEFICKWFGKGRQMAVTGRLQVRNWEDKQGNKRRTAEVVVDEAFFADSKSEGSGSGPRETGRGGDYSRGSQIPAPRNSAPADALPFDLGPEGDAYGDLDLDDVELPY